MCPDCFGGVKEEAPCVCESERTLPEGPGIDSRFLLPPLDPRDESRHPDDFNLPAWAED